MTVKNLLFVAFLILGAIFIRIGLTSTDRENFPFEDMIISLMGILFMIIGLVIKKSEIK